MKVIFDELEHLARLKQIRDLSNDAVADSLCGSYDCVRVWQAWYVGTMTEEDFIDIADNPERTWEISDNALAPAIVYIQELKEENDSLKFELMKLKGENNDS